MSNSKCEIDSFGTKRWRNDKDQLHREDGPAIESVSGYKEWWINGKLHREDGPAVVYDNGNNYWFYEGLLHRDEGPAVIDAHGGKVWWVNGQLHREDGPAVEKHSQKEWYLNNKRHRLDGPAIEYVYGAGEWWIAGKIYSKYEFAQAVISFLLDCDEKTSKLILKLFNDTI